MVWVHMNFAITYLSHCLFCYSPGSFGFSRLNAPKCRAPAFRSLTISAKTDEIVQELQSHFLAFLGVKLRGEDVFSQNRISKGFSVSCLGGDNGRIHRLWKKAVDKIDVALVGDPLKQRAFRLGDLKLVPADLRNLQSIAIRKADNFALKNSHTRGTT